VLGARQGLATGSKEKFEGCNVVAGRCDVQESQISSALLQAASCNRHEPPNRRLRLVRVLSNRMTV
jgi:hypothetical protein